MLKITIPAIEQYDDINNKFITSNKQILQIEHSLVSLSKWESKWGKPFLSKDEKSFEEAIDYIRCMTITQNVSDECYSAIDSEIIKQVRDYIDAPMTATVISKNEKKSFSSKIITAEIIYYWMVAATIPFECQKWHLNRLLTLIDVCNIENAPKKKMSRKELLARNKATNDARRAKLNTKG